MARTRQADDVDMDAFKEQAKAEQAKALKDLEYMLAEAKRQDARDRARRNDEILELAQCRSWFRLLLSGTLTEGGQRAIEREISAWLDKPSF